jgi:hypothetical protein
MRPLIPVSSNLNHFKTLDKVVQGLHLGKEGLEKIKGQGTGAIALGLGRVWVGFNE